MLTQFHNFSKKYLTNIVLIGFVVGIPFLLFYNLGNNPRPWHDEGIYLGLARTLAEDGVYANKNSDGYQTFGAVQSIGPTVILPIAGIYRAFGVGLLQGRILVVIYTLVALLLYFFIGERLFDRQTAILGVFFLLAAPAVRIFLYGREAMGEVPGFTFLLGGLLLVANALQKHSPGSTFLAGLLFGGAIITKSQYLLILPATLVIVGLLDHFYYHQRAWKILYMVSLIAVCCWGVWQAWQINYFGWELYKENLAKLRELASVTSGFHLQSAVNGIRTIFGTDSGHFYLFWGFPALMYTVILSARRSLNGLLLSTLVIFSSLWILYFIFWSISWHRYGLPAMSLIALFVSKLFIDISRISIPNLRNIFQSQLSTEDIIKNSLLTIGCAVGLFSYGMWACYNLQQQIRLDVLDKIGVTEGIHYTPLQLQNPRLFSTYLNQNIPSGAIIETWERELGILTNLTYHYPDQSMLTYTHRTLYRSGQVDYLLGRDYLIEHNIDYIIIGFYARTSPIYDMDYINENFPLIKRVGDDYYGYDLYQVKH